MRPNRTLPPAFSLAVLAAFPLALLSGCVEGELEPGYEEALVDALVEEIETGLWRDRPMTGDGNPLAYGDGDWDFRCGGTGSYDGDKQDCTLECWIRGGGGHRNCFCMIRLDGGERGYCRFTTGGGGGGGGGGPGGGNGRGGGGGGRDPGEEPYGVELECDKGKTRGTSAGCRVETELPMDSMRFDWRAGNNTMEGSGEKYSSWDGTATEHRKFRLDIADGRRLWMLTDSVTVDARDWKLPERSADLKWVDKIPDYPKAWGYYQGGEPSPDTLEGTTQGSGPWEGRYILSGKPTITAAAMYAHNDLKSGGPEYAIPDSVTICGLSGVSRSVYSLNDKCDLEQRVDDFRRYVDEHENGHQNSLNKCIKAVNTDGRLAAVEAIVEESAGAAEDSAEVLWTNGVYAALR